LCVWCRRPFVPEPRAAGGQVYCHRVVCRKISALTSQERWRTGKTGQAYHRGDAGVIRVREWRKAHPGYWRRRSKISGGGKKNQRALSAVLIRFFKRDPRVALQDLWSPQIVALIGVIAWLRGDALQDRIANDVREIMLRGNAILDQHRFTAPKRKRPAPRRRH